MRVRSCVGKALLVVAVAAESGVLAATAQAGRSQGRSGSLASNCAKLKVRATPTVNAQTAPDETITSKVKNCSAASETVRLVQVITSDSGSPPTTKNWKITVSPGHTVLKTRSLPYTCCGTYKVTDKVYTSHHVRLAKATTSFTFA